jgi:hypothetical protein
MWCDISTGKARLLVPACHSWQVFAALHRPNVRAYSNFPGTIKNFCVLKLLDFCSLYFCDQSFSRFGDLPKALKKSGNSIPPGGGWRWSPLKGGAGGSPRSLHQEKGEGTCKVHPCYLCY